MSFKKRPAALSVFVIYELAEYVAYEDVHLLYACGVVRGDYDDSFAWGSGILMGGGSPPVLLG